MVNGYAATTRQGIKSPIPPTRNVGARGRRRQLPEALFAVCLGAPDGNMIAKESKHFPSRVRPSRLGI
jgi:hypothetical protein